ETATQKAESDVKPSKAVETVKASSKPASSETTTKAADAAAKPNDKEEASKPSQEKASTQTKRSNRSKAEETATQKAKGDTKPSNTVATVKASSIASNSASEKTKAADDAAKPSIEEEEAASSQTKSSGSSAKRDKATQKAESNGKRSKAVPSVKAAAKARPAKEAKPKDATAKQKVEKQMPQSSQEAAAASAKGGSRRVECEASAAACGPQTFAYSGSFEADVQKILAGAVLEDSSSKVSTISEDDTPAQAARDTAKKRKAAEKKAQATEEHLESLIERKINLIAVAVVGDLHRNGHIQTVLVAEVEKGRASVFVSEDLLKGSKAQAALKVLLEAKEVVKVMHDCRMAADALQSLLDIQLCSVFDTAIAWQMLQDTDRDAASYGLNVKGRGKTPLVILHEGTGKVLQKYAPLAFKEMHKVLPPQKKTLPKPEQAIFDVLGLSDAQMYKRC
ncbi:EXD1, partial [Symbiodinium sp. KB8]